MKFLVPIHPFHEKMYATNFDNMMHVGYYIASEVSTIYNKIYDIYADSFQDLIDDYAVTIGDVIIFRRSEQ